MAQERKGTCGGTNSGNASFVESIPEGGLLKAVHKFSPFPPPLEERGRGGTVLGGCLLMVLIGGW